MKIKLLMCVLLLCSGLQAQEAGSMEFLHENGVLVGPVEFAVNMLQNFFKKQEKSETVQPFSNIKRARVIATAATFFAACALIKYFEEPAVDTSGEASDIETDNSAPSTQEATQTA